MNVGKQGTTIGQRIKGKVTEDNVDRVSIVQGSKSGSGNAIGRVVDEDAVLTVTNVRGVDMVGDVSPEVQKYAVKVNAGNLLEVAVKFSDGSEKFVRKYKSDQTIYDVSAGIMKKRGQKIKHIVNTKTEEIEDEDTEISTLRDRGHLKSLRAVLE